MKYLLALTIAVAVFLFLNRKPLILPAQNPSPTPQTSPLALGFNLNLENRNYRAFFQKIADPKNLILIPNFREKKLSSTVMLDNNCSSGINGGFYTKNGLPLGLFYSAGEYLSDTTHNQAFFNGFVIHSASGVFDIVTQAPNPEQKNLDFFFQTGPVLNPQQKLSIKNDERSRRILLAKTIDGEFFFLALTEDGNNNSGPYLEDVPKLLQKLPLAIASAINLDGGSASFFYQREGIKLSELVTVGSFLCIR